MPSNHLPEWNTMFLPSFGFGRHACDGGARVSTVLDIVK